MRPVKVRIMLNDGCNVLSEDLIVGAVHKFALVRILIDSASAIAVMDRQTVDSMSIQHF